MSFQDDDPHRAYGLGSPEPANDQSLKMIREHLAEVDDLLDIFETTTPSETQQRLLLSQVAIKLDTVRAAVLEIEYACLKVPNTDARPQSVLIVPVQE